MDRKECYRLTHPLSEISGYATAVRDESRRLLHCKAVEQRATLIHRQYNRDWGTSYSRPPIDPYLSSPVTKSWRRHWVWLSVWSEVQTCIWPSWGHCHSLSLASVKSRLVLPFWYQPTRVVPDKGPLNGCVCVCVCVCVLVVTLQSRRRSKCFSTRHKATRKNKAHTSRWKSEFYPGLFTRPVTCKAKASPKAENVKVNFQLNATVNPFLVNFESFSLFSEKKTAVT